jgi:hypothetical protein
MPFASCWTGAQPNRPAAGRTNHDSGPPFHLFLNRAKSEILRERLDPALQRSRARTIAHEISLLLSKNMTSGRFLLSYSCLQLKRIVNTSAERPKML